MGQNTAQALQHDYVLENIQESIRLEEQSTNELYSVAQELHNTPVEKNAIVLDAGCGSGLLSRHLMDLVTAGELNGCDLSLERIKFAREKESKINFFEHDLINTDLDQNRYTHIFNRYVAHHLGNESYKKVLKNFFQSLRPEGRITIIDPDGIFHNIGTHNKTLLQYLTTITQSFSGNLQIARFIPGMLAQLGFKNISWEIITMDFQEENRDFEVEQWKQRIDFGFDFYCEALGSRDKAVHFKTILLEEVANESVPIFYNKFVINAQK